MFDDLSANDDYILIFQACDWFEYYTGNTHLPEYVRENPRGTSNANSSRSVTQSLGLEQNN